MEEINEILYLLTKYKIHYDLGTRIEEERVILECYGYTNKRYLIFKFINNNLKYVIDLVTFAKLITEKGVVTCQQ